MMAWHSTSRGAPEHQMVSGIFLTHTRGIQWTHVHIGAHVCGALGPTKLGVTHILEA